MLVSLPIPKDTSDCAYEVGVSRGGSPTVLARIDLSKVKRRLSSDQVQAILSGPVRLWVEFAPGVYCAEGDFRDTLRGIGYEVVPDWEIIRDLVGRARAAAEALEIDRAVAVLDELGDCAVGYADGVDQILKADTHRAASPDPWVLHVSWAEGPTERAPYIGCNDNPARGVLAFRWIRLRKAPGVN